MDQITLKRYEAKVDSTGDCHVWIGARNDYGYGQLRINYKIHYAHRLAYEVAKGPIAPGMVIDHMCHNPSCVNPKHLQAVTNKQNIENIGYGRSSTGFRGVYRTRGGRYAAQVGHHGKKHFGGVHSTPEEANDAAIALRNRLFTNNLSDH